MTITRRDFLLSSSVAIVGLRGLRSALAQGVVQELGLVESSPYFSLPRGFSATLISQTGDAMADGLKVPGKPDGMAAFAMPGGLCAVVRNHENEIDWLDKSPYGKDAALLSRIDSSKIYDDGVSGPSLGGCSTLVFDTKQQTLVRQFLSLAGTERNCSGGATPWGTWITAEESVQRAGSKHRMDHGYNFEVTPSLQPSLSNPLPLRAMGRFRREAAAVDPKNGYVYQTEDREDGLFYRFIPAVPGQLAKGGKLQALMIRDAASYDTRNWIEEKIITGQKLPCQWVDMYDVESPKDDLRQRGFAQGAACFARAEGACFAEGSIYFAATNGGRSKRGQLWKYTHNQAGGVLELFVEADDGVAMKSPDNLCLGPKGDLYVCEDAGRGSRILRVNARGEVVVFAQNIFNDSELAGVCFSPDGTTMFVNIQHDPGMTFAITGPWV